LGLREENCVFSGWGKGERTHHHAKKPEHRASFARGKRRRQSKKRGNEERSHQPGKRKDLPLPVSKESVTEGWHDTCATVPVKGSISAEGQRIFEIKGNPREIFQKENNREKGTITETEG